MAIVSELSERGTAATESAVPRQLSPDWLWQRTRKLAELTQRHMTFKSRHVIRRVLLGVFLLTGLPLASLAQDPASFFQQNCSSCHTIGGGQLVGPDLRSVLQRKDRAWLQKFLMNPQSALDSGGDYAKKLLEESNGMVMPSIPGLDQAEAGALLDWIDAQSKTGSAAPAEAPRSEEPVFTPADATLGREIVIGGHALANGGTPCISCHSFRGIPSLGGGSLGPDLTHEYKRLGGGRAVVAWLTSPATPNMQSVYKTRPLKPDEIHALAAYLESLTHSNEGNAEHEWPVFLALGVGGCLIALVGMDAFWSKRFKAVRRPLVAGRRGQP